MLKTQKEQKLEDEIREIIMDHLSDWNEHSGVGEITDIGLDMAVIDLASLIMREKEEK